MAGTMQKIESPWGSHVLCLWIAQLVVATGIYSEEPGLNAISHPVAGESRVEKTDGGLVAVQNSIRAIPGSHWLEFRGKPFLPVGDSITQGWMELGENFDQHAYLDALARRGINAVLLWAYIGITDQKADERIAYDAPEIWPWIRKDGRFDLSRFNEAYFDRLRDFVRLADERNIVVVITVHDGWVKTRFQGHPFSRANGGPLESRGQYVELHDGNQEMPRQFDAQWSRRQRHQYHLERFCARLIEATADGPNVMYEMFNEGEWYDENDLRAFQVHFLKFFEARTRRPLVVNDDHVGEPDFRHEPSADVISMHKPRWDDLPPARTFFDCYASHYHDKPVKPFLFGEPVPEYAGDASRHQGIVRMLWGTALGGAGVVVQNDASWGFDPRSALAANAAERDKVLDLEGHLARFVNASDLPFSRMLPEGRLSSTGICLAAPPDEYLVYAQDGTRFTVDLSAANHMFHVRWYDPSTGRSADGGGVIGGNAAETFTPPRQADAVLRLARTSPRD